MSTENGQGAGSGAGSASGSVTVTVNGRPLTLTGGQDGQWSVDSIVAQAHGHAGPDDWPNPGPDPGFVPGVPGREDPDPGNPCGGGGMCLKPHQVSMSLSGGEAFTMRPM